MPATHAHAGIAAWNFKLKVDVHSYDQAREAFDSLYLSAAGDKGFRAYGGGTRLEYKIGPNMWLRDGDGYYAVVLYDTEIIRYYADGTFSVDNGDFATPTTTERLQAVLPDGFRCYHFSTREIKGKLGLMYRRDTPYPRRRKTQAEGVLWPLDHGVRIIAAGTAEDGTAVPRGVEYPYVDLSHSMTVGDLPEGVS